MVMKMMKSTLIISCLLILMLGLVQGFSVEITPVKDTILPMESATYNVVLTNDDEPGTDVISISADATNWILTPQSVSLPYGASDEFELYITPKSGVSLSNYRIPVVFEGSKSKTIIQESLFLSLGLDLLTKGYPPNIALEVTADEALDPRDAFPIDIFIRNNNLREFDEIVVTASSDLFAEDAKGPLKALATYRKKFSFTLNPYLPPGSHDLLVKVALSDGTVIAQDESTFEVKAYASLDTSRTTDKRGFLKSVETIHLFNDGNKEITNKPITYELSALGDIFLKAEPKGVIVKDNMGRKISWDVSLAPQERQEIQLTRNFVPLALVIVGILLVIFAYYSLRSPIISLKETQVTGADNEGVYEMKIRVFIKNRSKQTVNNLKIIDRIPHIATFMSNANLGTLQPTKVTKSDKRGTIVRWEIESLEPYEERIISYKVKSKLKIVGRMAFPEARIKFQKGSNGRERVIGSGISRMAK